MSNIKPQSKPASMPKQILSGCIYECHLYLLSGQEMDLKKLGQITEKLNYIYSMIE